VDTNTILLGVALVFASTVCAVAIWALVEGVKTARSARTLSDDLDERLVPLLDKADVTVDALNAELLRIDAIVTRIEEITDSVENTTRTVQGVANAPGEIVTDLADRVRRAWKRRQAEAQAASAAREAGAPSEGAGAPSSEGASAAQAGGEGESDGSTPGDDSSEPTVRLVPDLADTPTVTDDAPSV
jgi:hypothetical protein